MSFRSSRLGAGALSLALAVTACGRAQAPARDVAPSAAPAFALADLAGKTVRLSDSAGRVRLINFWATWCGPCRESIPDLNELHASYEKDGLSIIGISMDDDPKETLPSFIQKYKIQYTTLVGTEEVAEAFGGVLGLPTTFLLDRDGKVVEKWIGGTPKAVIESRVRSVLGLAPKA